MAQRRMVTLKAVPVFSAVLRKERPKLDDARRRGGKHEPAGIEGRLRLARNGTKSSALSEKKQGRLSKRGGGILISICRRSGGDRAFFFLKKKMELAG